MKVIEPAYRYALEAIDGGEDQVVTFVKRFQGAKNHGGTQCQELLRVVIDRTILLDKERPWPLNQELLTHLRIALVLYEARALQRKVEKGELNPEELPVNVEDGHFQL